MADMVTYEIEQAIEPFGENALRRIRLTVPSTWKVTYGPLFVGGKGAYGGDAGGAVLRFYEADTKQRALFRRVVQFRDVSLDCQMEVIEVEAEAQSKDDGKGNVKVRSERKATPRFEKV